MNGQRAELIGHRIPQFGSEKPNPNFSRAGELCSHSCQTIRTVTARIDSAKISVTAIGHLVAAEPAFRTIVAFADDGGGGGGHAIDLLDQSDLLLFLGDDGLGKWRVAQCLRSPSGPSVSIQARKSVIAFFFVGVFDLGSGSAAR